MKEPKVEVGILFEPQIEFILLTPYHTSGKEVCGKQVVTYNEGRILWSGRQYDELLFEPLEETAAFELLDVTIGINFHWERKEDQRFSGSLKIIVENGKLTGINVIHIEDYLTSVISSEMSATASLELLKAHAVISRSWLLAQIRKNKEITEAHTGYSAFTQTDEELIRWYDREDHTHFDVCADDHCQRYQGITRASTDIVRQPLPADRCLLRKAISATPVSPNAAAVSSKNFNIAGKTPDALTSPNNVIIWQEAENSFPSCPT